MFQYSLLSIIRFSRTDPLSWQISLLRSFISLSLVASFFYRLASGSYSYILPMNLSYLLCWKIITAFKPFLLSSNIIYPSMLRSLSPNSIPPNFIVGKKYVIFCPSLKVMLFGPSFFIINVLVLIFVLNS